MFRRIRHRLGAGGRARQEAVPEQVTAIRSSIGRFGDPSDIVLQGIEADVATEGQVAAEIARPPGRRSQRQGDARS